MRTHSLQVGDCASRPAETSPLLAEPSLVEPVDPDGAPLAAASLVRAPLAAASFADTPVAAASPAGAPEAPTGEPLLASVAPPEARSPLSPMGEPLSSRPLVPA